MIIGYLFGKKGRARGRRGSSMALTNYYLTDERWAMIASHLSGKEGDPGCHGRDNRLFIEAVLWIVRTGSPWRSLPPHFGNWYTNYTRFHRWRRKQVWPRVLNALATDETCVYFYEDGAIRVGRWRSEKLPKEAPAWTRAQSILCAKCGGRPDRPFECNGTQWTRCSVCEQKSRVSDIQCEVIEQHINRLVERRNAPRRSYKWILLGDGFAVVAERHPAKRSPIESSQ